jgi:hypothetical protein
MKCNWGFKIISLSCQLKKIYTKFNNKLHSLQRYDTAQNYRILHRVVQHLCQHYLKILHNCHIQMLQQMK